MSVWMKFSIDILTGLVQTDCKSYKQMTTGKVATSGVRVTVPKIVSPGHIL